VLFQSYCSLVFKFFDTLHFLATLLGLGAMYDVHLRLIGKYVVDFLLVLVELVLLDVMAEVLLAKID